MESMILATKSGTPIIGQIAVVMGWIMNAIYKVLDMVGIQNLGLCIIIFSILIYLCMTPLQIKQQKFSKLSAIMQPEIQKIQKKYQGKKDQDSMMKMQEETQAVYQKYGVSATGSCVQLAIQLPILYALYQVIQNIPAYVGSVYNVFNGVCTKILAVDGFTDIINNFIADNKMTRVRQVTDNADSIVDFLYALSPSQWKSLQDISQFSGFSDQISKTASEIQKMQTFGVLNIADQPLSYIKTGSLILIIAALAIPLLSWATQMLNLKLMPQAATQNGNDDNNAMASSMKTMNTVMPLMSAFFCFTVPVGLGIYWIASAVVRSIQQLLINRHLNKMNIYDLVNENMRKMEAKRAKEGLPPQKITNQAHQSAKNINKVENHEPYRMMTSRAEYRLLLRQDNADLRLRKKGYQVGLIDEETYQAVLRKEEAIQKEIERTEHATIGGTPEVQKLLEEKGSTLLKSGTTIAELIRRPELNYEDLAPIDKERPELPWDVKQQVEINLKYEGYIKRQLKQVEQFKKLEAKKIPEDLDYEKVGSLRIEARQKLEEYRPISIGQASRISGVSPADISVLLVYLEQYRRNSNS